MPCVSYIVGLALGQMSDFAALALLKVNDAGGYSERLTFDVTYLHRWRIGTPYTKIAEGAAKMLVDEPFKSTGSRTTLAIDASEAGRPIITIFENARLRANIVPITITGGHTAQADAGGHLVPKQILVSTLQLVLQTGRLKVASKLPESKTLTQELQNYQLSPTERINDIYEGRRGAQDGLILAVAVALWVETFAQVRVTDEEREVFRKILPGAGVKRKVYGYDY